jgi:membrane-associated phospholipid phosphatase
MRRVTEGIRLPRRLGRLRAALVILALTAGLCPAQEDSRPGLSLLGTPKRVIEDQSLLFTSPFRVHKRDLAWIVPFGALTGLLIASDQHTMTAHIRSNPLAVSRSETVSNTSLAALSAIPFAMYGLGRWHYDSHLQEGAVLAGEAAVDSLILDEVLKYSFRRARPTQANAGGPFFQSSWSDTSFPSGHAMLSWSLASAMAHRYPGWLTETALYSLAAAASLPRITAEKHFPTDVVVGGVLGWLVGREIFKRRHIDWDPVVSSAAATPRQRTPQPAFYAPEREHPGRRTGPILVPMDSWIYPVLARLAALGYIPDEASGLRPWTREECIRQLGEAEEIRAYRAQHPGADNSEAASLLIVALREEFGRDHDSTDYIELESVYGRYLGVSGTPLIDGYNFGQTVINDYGRPVGEGSNEVGGFSAAAVAGRVSFYTRDEYQHAPPFASPALGLKAGAHQLEPVLPGAPNGAGRLRPVEMYAGVQLGGWALTVGKQDLWWGPGASGPLSFSNDADPFYSFRFTSTSPIILPGFLRLLGGFRLDLIGGKLSGHQLPPRPLLNGQKLTWNVTKTFELGFTRWSLFDGAGAHGFNAASVIKNLFANGATSGSAIDPGDRKSGFDFRWRLPGLLKRVTLYSDFYADDEPNPLTSPRRSAFSPGIYLATLPRLSKWDLTVEAPSTRLGTDHGGFFLYWNNVYNDANTNRGNLLGSWVGRDGRGLLVQSTYWHSARSQLQFSYRQNRIGPAFLPGGGTQDNGSVRALWMVKPDWVADGSVQYERYFIPLLGGLRHDVVVSVQMTYTPRWRPFHN